jgi:hypothetical protein
MVYTLNFSKQALKELGEIHEPFYSNIKQAIFDLAENPRPHGYKKLKAGTVTGSEWETTELFMIFLIPCLWLILSPLGIERIFINNIIS